MRNSKVRPKKSLGQNFLTAPYYAEKIASSLPVTDAAPLLEIGPGQGALSLLLKNSYSNFHLVEKDRELIPLLQKKLGAGTWSLHQGDILTFDLSPLGAPLHVVGNLPYNIASLIIKKVLLSAPQVASITFMVQREVAERIVATPNSKTIGFISIFCQFFGTPKILFHVPNGAFFPKPKIESSVFQLVVEDDMGSALDRGEWEDFFALVSRGFAMRRKMLAKVLSWKKENKEVYRDLLLTLGLDTKVRAENLTVENWIALYKATKESIL